MEFTLNFSELFSVIFMTGGVSLLLLPVFYSWYVSKPRHFWYTKLTYQDKEIQSLIRFLWLAGVLLIIIGSIIYALTGPFKSDGFWWILTDMATLLVFPWVLLRVFLFISIVGTSLWNWAVHGTPLFKKSKKGGA